VVGNPFSILLHALLSLFIASPALIDARTNEFMQAEVDTNTLHNASIRVSNNLCSSGAICSSISLFVIVAPRCAC